MNILGPNQTLIIDESETTIWFNVLRCIVFSFTTLFIIAGNTICLIVLQSPACKIHPMTKLFMSSLASSDIIMGLFVAAPMIFSSALDRWPYGEFACDVYAIGKYVCYFSGLFSLVAVTVERYIMVIAPLQYLRIVTARGARFALVGIWALSLLIAGIFGFATNWKGEVDDDEDNCSLELDSSDFWYYPLRYAEFSFIAVPVLLVVTLYTHMWLEARRHVRGRGMAADAAAANRSEVRAEDSRQMNVNAAVTFLIVTVAFIIAWTPAATRKLYKLITKMSDTEFTEFLSRTAALTNSWLNVCIYYLRNRHFKNAAMRYFRFGHNERSAVVVPSM